MNDENNGWLPIKHNPPPEGEEIHVSDGKYIAQVEWRDKSYNWPSYISGYEWECYLDTPLYWKPLGELPVVIAEDVPEPVELECVKRDEYDIDSQLQIEAGRIEKAWIERKLKERPCSDMIISQEWPDGMAAPYPAEDLPDSVEINGTAIKLDNTEEVK